MKTFNTLVIVAILALSLCWPGRITYSRTVSPAPAYVSLNLRSESQIRSEASLYDAAIRDINRAATIKLDTIEDLKAANALLEKAIPNLKFNRSKLVSLGLNDSTFVSAAKDKVRDSKSAEAIAKELATDRRAVLKLPGASALQSRISQSLQTDIALIRAVAARWQKSAEALKAKIKADHASTTSIRSIHTDTKNSAVTAPAFDANSDTVALVIVVAVLVVAVPPLAIALVDLSSAAVTVVAVAEVIAGAAFVIVQLVENIGTDKGRDKVAACQDQVARDFEHCKAQAAEKCCGLDVIETAGCVATWALLSAGCLLS